jgi:hypothetical protein
MSKSVRWQRDRSSVVRCLQLVTLVVTSACGGGGEPEAAETATDAASGMNSAPGAPTAAAAGSSAAGSKAPAGTPATAGTGSAATPGGTPPGATQDNTPAAGGATAKEPSTDPGNAAAAGAGGSEPPPTDPGGAETSPYSDPGTGPWTMGSAEECKMDTSMIGGVSNLAVFRYGKLCHVQGGNTTGQNWSATKTLGGVLGGRAAYLVKDVARSGPGTGPILHEDKATDWLGSVSFNQEALLSHFMAMVAHNLNLAYGSKSFSYDTVGTVQISSILGVASKALEQQSAAPTNTNMFMSEQVFQKLGMADSSWPGGTIGYGWTGTLEDMGRVGTMLVHDGWYGGERFMEASWVYRMSHPSHEDANTAYGQLAWLNNRGGGTSFGAAIDDCAPAAFWPKYPHVGSEAPDCGARDGNCTQENDVGVFSAQGLGGQFVVMHPGLDLVIAAHNASDPATLWANIRPAVVAMDPKFKGDMAGFCAAYGSGAYAPDLLVPRVAPSM